MVNIRLLQQGILFTIIMFSNSCFATAQNHSPQLILFTDKSDSILGRPIRAELYGVSLKSKISNIKLNHLSENFGVVTDYVIAETSDNRWPNQAVQILKLKLYPRRTGKIVIPSFVTNKVKSLEKIINITAGKTGLPEIIISSNEPYERQQIVIIVTITSPDSTSRLSIEENPEINNFEITPLPFKRTQDQTGKYLLQIGWAVNALKSGQLKIEFPAIEYSVSGVSRKKFYLPATTLNIKKLPAYLPPTIPVGKITIQSQLSVTSLLQSNTLAYWNVELSGFLNNSYSLPPILRQIKSNKYIKFLPVNSQRSIKARGNGLTSTVHHSIPFKAIKSGFLNFPEIRLQYFDPENGKIKTIFYNTKDIFVLSFFWRSLVSLLILFLSLYLLNITYKKWLQLKFSKRKRQQAIQVLQGNNNVEKIRESLRLLAEAEYWPKNMSLTQWQQNWSKKYKTDVTFNSIINNISKACYSKADLKKEELDKLANKVINIIEKRNKIYSNSNPSLFLFLRLFPRL